jgi:hypothetical protein
LRSDLSWTYHFARQFDKAISTSREAADLDPWSFTAHRQFAKALLLSSKYPDAIEETNRCAQINNRQRRRLLAELATAHVRAGQKTLADAVCHVRVAPDHAEHECSNTAQNRLLANILGMIRNSASLPLPKYILGTD